MKPFSNHDKIFIRTKKKPYEKASVFSPAQHPRSYKLLRKDSKVIERNKNDILKGANNMNFKVKNDHNFINEEPETVSDEISSNEQNIYVRPVMRLQVQSE